MKSEEDQKSHAGVNPNTQRQNLQKNVGSVIQSQPNIHPASSAVLGVFYF